jgi:hypothetical protein
VIHRTSAVAAVILGVAFLAAPGRGDDKAAANARARLEAARKVYQGMMDCGRKGDASFKLSSEELYRWSRRWMEAERDLADKPEARVAAAQAHLDRMAKWEEGIKRTHAVARTIYPYEVSAAEFYRLEAERGLAEAKAK